MFSDNDLEHCFIDLDFFPTDDITAIKQYLDRQNGNPFNMFYTTMRGVKRMKTVDLEQVSALINETSVIDIAILASQAGRGDVMKRAIGAPCLDNPEQLLGEWRVLANPEGLDAVLARLTPDVLNAKTFPQNHGSHVPHYPSDEQKACWEIVLDPKVGETEERFLTSVLPKLHAAGADLMDDRFETEDAEIASSPWDIGSDVTHGRSALAHYRRQMLAAELHALADEAVPEPAPSRARARL
ncbi:DEAD/DEAH box helicase family protein [Burkholderia vietnamiensis]|uniref:hypothetical protein n=1 Tax=Burkholderia vietnamiensis TaxID=60552 RepID=UPI001CF288E2|nr:hypothetical protein [Burkholderia vietnamiensis]MCA8448927.1 hypothetical protein [Burkholderia vietnamiensis]